MKTRILLGLFLIGCLGGIFYLDAWREVDEGFCFLAVVIMGMGAFEFYKMAKLPLGNILIGVFFTLALQVGTWLEIRHGVDISLPLLTLAIPLIFLFHFSFQPGEKTINNLALTLMGLFYIAFLGSFFIRIRAIPQWGQWLLLYTLVVSKGTDVFAYFTGSLIGRHKWIPMISPGKTWEGLLGGMAGAGALGVLLGWLLGGFEIFPWYSLLIFSTILGLIAQLGDLAESLIKRSFAVKDSASLLPEFGGILDLIDCLLFTGPVVYLTWTYIA